MRRAPAPRSRQGARGLRVAGYAGLGLGCVLVGAITFLIVAAPVDLARDRLIEQVKAHTGRDLVVSGPTSLVVFPRLALSLADVALAAPPGMGGEPTLAAKSLEAEISLASLLTGQAGLSRLVLVRPKIELRVDAQGRHSWDFARVGPASAPFADTGRRNEAPRLVPISAPATSVAPSNDGNVAAMLQRLSPASIGLREGSLHYGDERSGISHDVTALDVDVLLGDGEGPLQGKGSFVWNGETMTAAADLSSLRALIEERAARLSLRLAGRPVEARYDGKIDIGAGLALKGTLDLKSTSLETLGAWAGSKPLAAVREAGVLAFSSSLTFDNGRMALADLTGTLGDTSLSANLAIEPRPTRPYASGTLHLSALDLGGLLIRPASNAVPEPVLSEPRPAAAGPPKGPQVRGFTKRAGGADWSDDRIDPSPLTLADADLAVAADRLVYKDVKTGPVRLALALDDSVARLTLREVTLYEGRARGVASLDGRGQAPAVTVNMLLEGVSAQPLLKDALGFDWLEGKSTLTVALAGQGASERQIVATLNGKIDLAANNGTIDAIDVGKILRGIEQGRFAGLRVAQGEKTPFSELAGSFTLANGIADNQDLRLVSPNLRITGAGSFNLPARSLDYTVRAKVATLNASTERAVINLSNVEIPVRIEGAWDRPTFSLAGQEQILEAVKQIGKSIKSQDVQDAIKGLLGEGDGQQKVKPRDILEKLLKKQ
jgi:AsmA protein